MAITATRLKKHRGYLKVGVVNYLLLEGDVMSRLQELESKSVQCCITSPPYWGLRDYGMDAQIGLELSFDEYVAKMVQVFSAVKRVLADDGTLWLNLGDSYAGSGKGRNGDGSQSIHVNSKQATSKGTTSGLLLRAELHGLKPKDLVGIPWRVAFALQADGWYLRQEIIWAKPNPMPESVTDRCTKSHEHIFLLSKSQHYFFDNDAIKEPAQNWGTRDRSEMRDGTQDPLLKHHGLAGKPDEENPTRNKRDVWTVPTKGFKGAHFATFPPELIRPMVLAGTSAHGKCDACGLQYVKVMENGETPERRTRDATLGVIPGRDSVTRLQSVDMEAISKKHVGWRASCQCVGAGVVASVVLDPFAGSGTTLYVANEEKRDAVGVELNPAYAGMIRERLSQLPIGLFD